MQRCYLVRREAAMLSYLFQYVFSVDTKERDRGELAAHVLERMATMIDAVVHNQPAVMGRGLPDECLHRCSAGFLVQVTQVRQVLAGIDGRAFRRWRRPRRCR